MKTSRLVLFILIVLLFVPFSAVFAQSTEAKLASDQTVVESGSSFNLGVHFKMQPGWHIYWRDPGESGLPTKVTFVLPEGFEASELYWPEHHTFTQPGNIKANGYEEEVLIWSKIKVPVGVAGEQKITVKASWLNCSNDLCVPARKTFEHPVLIGDSVPSPDKALFELWETRLPKL